MKGFTLIELLVVVLIIGILSAVALPQYTRAVEKSRIASAWTILDGMRKAVTVYELANGSDSLSSLRSSNPWDGLDLGFSLEQVAVGSQTYLKDKNFHYQLDLPEQVRAYRNNSSGGFPGNFDLTIKIQSSVASLAPGARTCAARTAEGHNICKSLGGKLRSGSTSDYVL